MYIYLYNEMHGIARVPVDTPSLLFCKFSCRVLVSGGSCMCEKIWESAGEPLSVCVKTLINEERKRKESEINDIE